MLSNKTGMELTVKDPTKVKIIQGHWFKQEDSSQKLPIEMQTEEDLNMEQEWKKYVTIKKHKKQ